MTKMTSDFFVDPLRAWGVYGYPGDVSTARCNAPKRLARASKLQIAAAGVLPQSIPAEIHRGMAERGSGKKE